MANRFLSLGLRIYTHSGPVAAPRDLLLLSSLLSLRGWSGFREAQICATRHTPACASTRRHMASRPLGLWAASIAPESTSRVLGMWLVSSRPEVHVESRCVTANEQ